MSGEFEVEPNIHQDLSLVVCHASLGVPLMYVQSYVVHGSPALGQLCSGHMGGEPLLAYHQTWAEMRVTDGIPSLPVLGVSSQAKGDSTTWIFPHGHAGTHYSCWTDSCYNI